MNIEALEGLKSLKLLYVEDDLATREELAMMLEPWVGELRVSVDGQEGLKLFKAWRPDIVITDIQMPRVNGLAMSGEIRRIVPNQPIVVVSAYNDVEYLFRAIELGIDQYITKPVNVERLLDKLAQMADGFLAVRDRQRNQVLLEQYKHMADQSAIVCKLDPTGRITYVNERLCAISGYAAEDLIGRDICVLRDAGEPRERCEAMLAQAKQGRKWAGICHNRTRQGVVYVVESSLVPILDEHGAVSEIVSLEVDVSHLSKANEELLESLGRSDLSLKEQRHFLGEYKRALELGTCICITDPQHRIISINAELGKLIGYRSEDLAGGPVTRIMPDMGDERSLDEVQQPGSDRVAGRIIRFLGRDGRELQFSVSFVCVRGVGGEAESIIMICQDVTKSQRISREIADTQRELLYMLGDVVETRSQETGHHVRRVAQVSKFLALKAGLDAEVAEMIEAAAPMHDVGKVGIRDAILCKDGKLTVEEFEEMKEHARIGFSLLDRVDRSLLGLAATIAHEHHERYDGKGYPHGLKGEEISIAARIVGIADVLDALGSPRVYKVAWDDQRILDYFREQRGLQFDPRLVDLLLAFWDPIKVLRNHGGEV